MRYTSGWFLVRLLAICWSRTVLPALGGETMRPRCPLPSGSQEIHDAHRVVSGIRLELEFLLRIEGSQVVKEHLVPNRFRVFTVDGFDLEEGEISLRILGRPDIAGYGVSGSEAEAPDLTG